MSPLIANASTLKVAWHKSSYSGADSNCVETALLAAQTLVRDSKNPNGPTLPFTHPAWTAFTTQMKQFN